MPLAFVSENVKSKEEIELSCAVLLMLRLVRTSWELGRGNAMIFVSFLAC